MALCLSLIIVDILFISVANGVVYLHQARCISRKKALIFRHSKRRFCGYLYIKDSCGGFLFMKHVWSPPLHLHNHLRINTVFGLYAHDVVSGLHGA